MARDAEAQARRGANRGSDELVRKLRKIATQAQATRSTGFRVPELDADPAADSPTTVWTLADGRLCWRTLDGIVHRVYPEAQRVYPILHRASDPAASTGIDIYRHTGSDELRVRRADNTWARYAPVNAATTSGDGGGNSGGGSTSTKPKPTDTAPKRYRKVYSPTWARTFCPEHGVETGGQLRYGTFAGSAHGNRRIMIGLDDATIRADLAGAAIRRTEIHLLNTDSWDYSGITIHFGAHNRSAAPAAYSTVRRNVWDDHWPHTGDGKFWRRTSDWFGRALRDNTIKGLTIHQPSDANGYYGEIDWSTFRLAIEYTK